MTLIKKIAKESLLRLMTPVTWKQNYLLILGHMRSGSTLVNHILLSSGSVNGIGESNIVYNEHIDITRLSAKSFLQGAHKYRQKRYICDQINHNNKTPDLSLFDPGRLKVIILYRRPHASVSSLLNLSSTYYNDSWTVKRATDYYIDRLLFLRATASQVKSAFYLSYEDLINDSQKHLFALEEYLGISLSSYESYDTFDFTGRSGDPAKLIKKGRIIKSSKEPLYLDPTLLNKMQKAYDLIHARQL